MKKILSALFALCFAASSFAAQKAISIDTQNTSLVLVVAEDGRVSLRHYGPGIADAARFEAYAPPRDYNCMTEVAAYTAQGDDFVGTPAFAATYPDGSLNTQLRYVSHSVRAVKPGVVRTEVLLKDIKQPLRVRLVYTAYTAEDVVESHAEIENLGKKEIVLRDYLSSTMCLRAEKYLLTRFWGSWSHEFQIERTLLTHGTTTIDGMFGVRNSQKTNASFMVSLDTDCFDEKAGNVVAGALKWSGNFVIDFTRDETGRLMINSGINPHSAEWHLAKGETFVTPDMVYTFSSCGAGQASRNLHDWARGYAMYDSSVVAPTLLNSWEGAYFNFNMKTLTDMIDDAASVGLEMFVLDDGWFGNGKYARDDDNAGLGDWQLNTAKLPEGIAYLADYAHSKGLKFGIWIEPEMVNPNSLLYEAHPDWVVGEAGRENPQIRQQYILDLSNPKVQDFVFGVFDSVMKLGDIDYIKWDCNRHVLNVGSNNQKYQSQFYTANTLGYYNVLRRVREAYPSVIVQSCSSGGGRIDYGVLGFCNEVWLSDDTDAVVRTEMQYGMSLIYPSIIMGSHISAVPNHQTQAITGIKYRSDIAASGRLGVELQPKQMTPEEMRVAKRAIAEYKGFRDVVYNGDLYRLQSPLEGNDAANIYVSKDKKKAVLFVYHTRYDGRSAMPRIRLDGLAAEGSYKVSEVNCDHSCFWGDGECFDADFLQNYGLDLALYSPATSAVFVLELQ